MESKDNAEAQSTQRSAEEAGNRGRSCCGCGKGLIARIGARGQQGHGMPCPYDVEESGDWLVGHDQVDQGAEGDGGGAFG